MSAPDGAARTDYGTIVIVGGGCYGSYYVRQLGRARAAGALGWSRVVVADRDPQCAVARALAAGDVATPGVTVAVSDWRTFFDAYLTGACADPAGSARDAIVPSPLMPHLMYEWLRDRASARWPDRPVATRAVDHAPDVPWQRAGPEGTRYVSYAEWICPVNCIEPSTCPKTRDVRWWSMPDALARYVTRERAAGRPLVGPVIFHCTHRAYGVGMFDTASVVHGEAVVREAGERGAADVLVGTVSHCHGALNILSIGEIARAGANT